MELCGVLEFDGTLEYEVELRATEMVALGDALFLAGNARHEGQVEIWENR